MPDTAILSLLQFQGDELAGVRVLSATHSAVGKHSHEFYELVYVRGGFCLHEAGDETTLITEGDLFLVRPGVKHRYVGKNAVELYNCIFTQRGYEPFADAVRALPGVMRAAGDERGVAKLHLSMSERKAITRLFGGMLEDDEKRMTGWRERMQCQLVCLLIDFARAYEVRASCAGEYFAYPNYVQLALSLIGERYQDAALSVAGVAERAGVSPDYLSRQFHMLTGVGVREYIRRFRFSKATELLLAGVTVNETSRRVGFANLAHFSREFKKELGVAPSRYASQYG